MIEPSAFISKFIRRGMPLLLLKLMAQSRRGVTQSGEVKVHPLTIEPSVLRAAKAASVE
jgi:hypothetical protein